MITIRQAAQQDCKSVWHIHIRAIKEICKSHYSQREINSWSSVLNPQRYEKAISKGGFFVATKGDAIVGFGNLNKDNGEVEAVYVAPDYKGRGVGMKILQAIETTAKDAGLTTVHLSASLNAVPFYKKAGYQPQRYRRYLLPFRMVACIPMIKELSST